MKTKIRILHVDDNKHDRLLVKDALLREHDGFEITEADNREKFEKLLEKGKFDLVLSDFNILGFDGLQVLEMVKEKRSDLPVIIVTGTGSEEVAIQALKMGASDYVIKSVKHIRGLVPTIFTVLEHKKSEGDRDNALRALRESEEYNRLLFNTSPIGLALSKMDGSLVDINPAFAKIIGRTVEDTLKLSYQDIVPEKYVQLEEEQLKSLEKTGYYGKYEKEFIHKDGHFVPVLLQGIILERNDERFIWSSVEDISKRKEAEIALQKSQHLFQTLAQVSPVGIFRTDQDGKTTYVNPKWKELSGLSSEEAFGNGWLKAVHPDDREKLSEVWLNNLKSINVSSAEYRFLKPDGSIVWVIGKAVPELSDNELIGYIGTITDITERKLAEEKIKSSEERLKILFDYAPDAYYLNDLKGNFIDGNIAAEKLLGYDRNELIGKSFLKLNLLSLKQIPRAAKLLVRNALGQGTGPDEFVLTRKNGSKVTVEIITHPVKIKGQTQVLGIARDITERRKAEEALKESEEKYRRIFENVQDMFFESSINGLLLEVSPSFELISKGQYKREDVIGKSMFDLLYNPAEGEIMMNDLMERGYILDYEIIFKNPDGSNIPCSVSSRVCFDVQGQPEKIIGSIRDITDRKNASDALKFAKEKAEASDKLKTTFLNNISHEVRTPLNGILGFAEIMSQADLSEEEKQDSISMLFESSDRLLSTITNYMDISLITSGYMGVNKKEFIPEQILKELLGKYKSICSVRKLELLLKLPEQPKSLSIYSDSEFLCKIMSHLLDNAIKFTEEGSIQYGYIIRNSDIEFFVKDTGIGIDEGSLESVFEQFTKEDRGPLRLTEGTGLGLSISKGLAELLGARIKVESEKGKGSCFYLIIPVTKKDEIHHSIIRTNTHNRNKTINTILVAEDDEVNFFYINSVLKKNTSTEIIHASNGREAIDKFKENPDINLVLMDIKMPVMDGLSATQAIKAIRRDVPVIAVTAYATTGDENKALEAGCDSYLPKPISRKQLLDKIAEFIEI